MQRYFSKEKKDNKFILQDSDYHHIKTVMRMKENDKVIVVYESNPYLCKINYKDNLVNIEIIKKQEKQEEFINEVTLIIPLLKEQKFDFILQKATELGVSRIIPVKLERTVVKIDQKEEKKLARWKSIVKEASEQSNRNTIPQIEKLTRIEDLPTSDLNIVCSTTEKENKINKIFKNIKKYDKINVVIGPEGGLTIKEEEYLKNIGYIPVTLGSRIMRVETVPIYILSIINYENME